MVSQSQNGDGFTWVRAGDKQKPPKPARKHGLVASYLQRRREPRSLPPDSAMLDKVAEDIATMKASLLEIERKPEPRIKTSANETRPTFSIMEKASTPLPPKSDAAYISNRAPTPQDLLEQRVQDKLQELKDVWAQLVRKGKMTQNQRERLCLELGEEEKNFPGKTRYDVFLPIIHNRILGYKKWFQEKSADTVRSNPFPPQTTGLSLAERLRAPISELNERSFPESVSSDPPIRPRQPGGLINRLSDAVQVSVAQSADILEPEPMPSHQDLKNALELLRRLENPHV